ncbi:hypothetical protein DMB95_08610 [Campylobacter sp. MIT 12-8780]|uniref:hypothetical protein n=1 Tax=unclassified Campylobacter TaxID=2593542 RepID=UPI0010F72C99|nr:MULTISPECIES: hypothetical protein [unclassified Campylobacter]NDJ27986.1 hypothetical protein [Campylobacter sp. MIT 19-121]TKX29749.1 hypothetical protein CQA38_02965 [Campylobacter sp. MIT 12-5580]TQR40082.1 hypothetical protein DMB95_08590 [Campylobacter sp. MIT 12-8780]TQR40084.1 hypothetical protein DMB95_08610 [Campylobacter sp. MIT 12-8780]
MKKLLVVAFAALLGASVALANEAVKGAAKAQGADVAGQLMSGKSAKEVAAAKKEEAKEAAKEEAGKQINKLLNF